MTKLEIKAEIEYIDVLIGRISKENFKLSTKLTLVREQTEIKRRLTESLHE